MSVLAIFEERAKQAVENHDPLEFGRILDALRVNFRKNYEDCAELFEEWTGIDRDEFEQLCHEADHAESRGI